MGSTRPGGWDGGEKGRKENGTGLFVDLPHFQNLLKKNLLSRCHLHPNTAHVALPNAEYCKTFP
jgi:hypothetical protein